MGGLFSISMPCDQVVNQVSQCLCVNGSYIYSLSENLAALQKDIEVLKAKRDDVQRRVDREEFTGRRERLSQVQVWLTTVQKTENKFNDLLSTNTCEVQRLCLCGFCSKNLKMSYLYGKRVVLLLREVESLSSQGGEFSVVTEITSVAMVDEIPVQPTIVGQETMLERVWTHLMKDGVEIVGMYGMGGVGKTTLLTQINNKFSETCGGFEVVIWVVVSKCIDIHRIQGDIAKKLGLEGEEWDQKNENQRALDIYHVLRRRKFVLLLDDIWEKVDLKALGVPHPSCQKGCKVVFTTRSREVCGHMGVDDPMEVSCLKPDKAWDLFERKVGENTLKSHPDIPSLARLLAGKCCGLPLALNVIGETMACKRMVQEWHNAINVLSSYAAEFSGMDQILPILKYSYDNLNKEQVKPCFLYCSLFPEDYRMEKEKLIEYWICEGFIDENESRERALSQGYEIIGILVRACLLLEEAINKEQVKMHDVVREMALWIASDLGKHKERCIVQAGVGLREVPQVKDWRAVKRMSLMENEIEMISDSPECQALTTLFLQKNDSLVHISAEFFRCMPMLVVLDLSGNSSLRKLPEQISELVSLRYLDLSWTYMKRLPLGLQELKKLIHLRLDYMKRLKSVSGISNLPSLRKLQLLQSKMSLDMSLVEELQLLEHLQVLNISIKSSLVIEKLLYAPRLVKCLQTVLLRGLQEESLKVLVLPGMDSLRKVIIRKCGMWEIEVEVERRRTLSLNRSPTTPQGFPNLSSVHISSCNGLKDLTWLLFAPNLNSLEVLDSGLVEEIIREEKATSVVIPFKKLESLRLHNLGMLKNIYWVPLPFPCLKTVHVTECPELRKLPLNSESVFKVEEIVIKYKEEEWFERLEWVDETTRLHFVPFFKFFGPEWQVTYVR